MTECHSFLTFLNLVVCPNVSVSLKNKIKKIQQISNFNSNQNINLQLALCNKPDGSPLSLNEYPTEAEVR
jgi:L-cystine uptake protein TcyP (sodium:dicarboxylate symporter family)